MMEKIESFIRCEKCGKKLIARQGNGIWHFRFGRSEDGGEPPVDMKIYGSIKMKCLRRSCRHINILNHFPFKI